MREKRRNGRFTTETSVEDEIVHLRGLDLKGLRARWQIVLQKTSARSFAPASVVCDHCLPDSSRPLRGPRPRDEAALGSYWGEGIRCDNVGPACELRSEADRA